VGGGTIGSALVKMGNCAGKAPESGISAEAIPTKVIVFDCGTGESKALLYELKAGGKIAVRELKKFGTFESFIMSDNTAELVELVAEIAAAAQEGGQCTRIALGLSAWFRDALQDTTPRGASTKSKAERAMIEVDVRLRCLEPPVQVDKIELSEIDEALFEATAVSYAAEYSGLPPTGVVVGSGGGSIQFTYLDPMGVSGPMPNSIPLGFRAGVKLMQEDAAAGADEWDTKCKEQIAAFMEQRGLAAKAGNCVAISACYYGSQLVKIGGDLQKVAANDVKAAFLAKKEELRKTLAGGAAEGMDAATKKKTFNDLANSTMQYHLFSNLLADGAQVHFGRNWVVDGENFRTTWSAGWFMRKHCC
jgi:hypothetical protein